MSQILKKYEKILRNTPPNEHVIAYLDNQCYTINKVTVYYVVYKSIVENLLNIVNKYYELREGEEGE